MRYFVIDNSGEEYGPADLDQLEVWRRERRLTPDSKVRPEGSQEFIVASEIPGLDFGAPQFADLNLGGVLRLAVFSLVCCCQPIGLIAVVFAVMARNDALLKNRERAALNAKTATNFAFWAIGLGVIWIFLLWRAANSR
jgi:hypothetical protein